MTLESTDREIVDLLFDVFDSFKEHFAAALDCVDLPMSHGHLLMCIHEPTPMTALARHLGFDASHITAIIDRLEERHLLERRPDPHDRRVKRITITETGAALREHIRNSVIDTLPPLHRLSAAQRTQLRDLLAAATATDPRERATGKGTRDVSPVK